MVYMGIMFRIFAARNILSVQIRIALIIVALCTCTEICILSKNEKNIIFFGFSNLQIVIFIT